MVWGLVRGRHGGDGVEGSVAAGQRFKQSEWNRRDGVEEWWCGVVANK